MMPKMDISCAGDALCVGNMPLMRRGEFPSFFMNHINAEIESHSGISKSALSCIKSFCGLIKNPYSVRKESSNHLNHIMLYNKKEIQGFLNSCRTGELGMWLVCLRINTVKRINYNA